jgi:hypothetical protein
MLKKPITYTDYNGDQCTDVFYFHLSEPELIDMEVEHERGFQAFIDKIIETKDRKGLISLFKQIILLSYGTKSDDGKRFIKSDQLREEFSQTAAYPVLYMELSTDANAGAEFLKGVMPKNLAIEVDKALASQKASETTS